ncbi:MAG: hypothetical protein KM312_13570, partial [Hydrogenibacillus schlegelii]|nr:hypothetical protein [Hydrogenibacillus schlegelii]
APEWGVPPEPLVGANAAGANAAGEQADIPADLGCPGNFGSGCLPDAFPTVEKRPGDAPPDVRPGGKNRQPS